MHVAICIVSYNNPHDCLACIEAVQASTYRDFSIVVCENGTVENAEALQRHLKRDRAVRIIRAPHNPGYAGGVNLCMEQSSEAQAWWILNPDTRPDPDALQHLVERLDRRDVEAVGGRIYYPDGTLQALGGLWHGPFPRVEAIGKGRPASFEVPQQLLDRANFIHGASMLVSRKFLETVGPMREDYFLYCEEVEWCLRALKRGVQLGFSTEAKVLHLQGTTTGSSRAWRHRPWMPIYLDERNKILVLRDTAPEQLWIGMPAGLILLLGRFGKRLAWRQIGYALHGWFAGLRNERGKPQRLNS